LTSESTRTELANYLKNWHEPLRPVDLADALGLSLATVRIYKSRMDLDPLGHPNLLPQPLPRRGKRVLYSHSAIIEWWASFGESLPAAKRGRPTKASQLEQMNNKVA
jgi:hypothetical protein